MNNSIPTYEELLVVNHALEVQCQKLKATINEQALQIEEFLRASTLYRELYFELWFKSKK